MSKVDKLATEKYPPQLTSEFEFGTEDLNEGLRRAFRAGYEQGSKDILEKACEWIKKNVLFWHPRKETYVCAVNIGVFKDAMLKDDIQSNDKEPSSVPE